MTNMKSDHGVLLQKYEAHKDQCKQVLQVLQKHREYSLNTSQLSSLTGVPLFDLAAVRSLLCLLELVALKPGTRNSRLWAITAKGNARLPPLPGTLDHALWGEIVTDASI